MRMVFLTNQFALPGEPGGGVSTYLGRVTRGLVERGDEVHVLFLGPPRRTFTSDGVTVHCRPCAPLTEGDAAARERPGPWGVGRAARTLARLLSEPQWLRRRPLISRLRMALAAWPHMQALQRRCRFDVAVLLSPGAAGLFCALWPACPCVTFAASYLRWYTRAAGVPRPLQVRLMEEMEIAMMRLSAAVYATSAATAERLRDEAGLDVHVILPPFFFDVEAEDESVWRGRLRGREYLLFYGRIGPLKGAPLLAEALAELLPAHPEMHVALAGGDQPLADGGSTLAAFLQRCTPWCDRVHVLGELPQAQLRPVVRGARLVVLPSRADNLPNTCIEAMALGRPVVGPDGASFDELIGDGRDGYLFRLGDAAALARRIDAAWNDPNREEIGRRAAAKVRELLDPPRATAALAAFLDDARRRARGGRR